MDDGIRTRDILSHSQTLQPAELHPPRSKHVSYTIHHLRPNASEKAKKAGRMTVFPGKNGGRKWGKEIGRAAGIMDRAEHGKGRGRKPDVSRGSSWVPDPCVGGLRFRFAERFFRPDKNHNYSIKNNKYCIAKTYDAVYS